MTDAKMCPREPTQEMLDAYVQTGGQGSKRMLWQLMYDAAAQWQLMYNAAPSTPEAEEVARLRACEAALRELVECDGLTKRAVDRYREADELSGKKDDDMREAIADLNNSGELAEIDRDRRFPLAWAAARAALSGGGK